MSGAHTDTDSESRAANVGDLIERLQDMAGASEALKNALMSRNPDAVRTAVAEQEELLRQLRAHSILEHSVQDGPSEHKEVVKTLVAGIKRVQRTNKALAGSFLRIVERTLSQLGASGQVEAGTYGPTGGMAANSMPVLVHQQG